MPEGQFTPQALYNGVWGFAPPLPANCYLLSATFYLSIAAPRGRSQSPKLIKIAEKHIDEAAF